VPRSLTIPYISKTAAIRMVREEGADPLHVAARIISQRRTELVQVSRLLSQRAPRDPADPPNDHAYVEMPGRLPEMAEVAGL
jgi:hypothetical protein